MLNVAENYSESDGRAVVGHNGVAGDQLISIIERIERLEEDKKQVSEDIKEVYSEAKGNGFDVKILRKLVGLRKIDADKREEEQAILELYADAMGMRL